MYPALGLQSFRNIGGFGFRDNELAGDEPKHFIYMGVGVHQAWNVH